MGGAKHKRRKSPGCSRRKASEVTRYSRVRNLLRALCTQHIAKRTPTLGSEDLMFGHGLFWRFLWVVAYKDRARAGPGRYGLFGVTSSLHIQFYGHLIFGGSGKFACIAPPCAVVSFCRTVGWQNNQRGRHGQAQIFPIFNRTG